MLNQNEPRQEKGTYEIRLNLNGKFFEPVVKVFKKFGRVGLALLVLVVALTVVNGALLFSARNGLGKTERPPKLSLTIIKDSSCSDCRDISPLVEEVKKRGAKIVSERTLERGSEEAQKLIRDLQIERIPTLLAQGELAKSQELSDLWKLTGTIKNDTFVFTRVFPPYAVAGTGEVKGRFSLVYLADTSCTECYDVTRHAAALLNLAMETQDDRTVEASSVEGKDLIRKYKITALPTILLSGDLTEYENFQVVWPQVGTVEADGMHVFREPGEKIMGTYKDLKTGKLVIAPAPQPAEAPAE